MIFSPFNLDRFTLDGHELTPREGGFFHFLRRLFGFAGGTMDPNGLQ